MRTFHNKTIIRIIVPLNCMSFPHTPDIRSENAIKTKLYRRGNVAILCQSYFMNIKDSRNKQNESASNNDFDEPKGKCIDASQTNMLI